MKKFIKQYGNITLLAIIILFFLSYIWFCLPGFFPTGDNLEKSQWLSFWGSFLAFGGSVFVGVVAIWQNNQADKTNQKIQQENRRNSQLEFENQLQRDKYLRIIDGIFCIYQRIENIAQDINQNRRQLTRIECNGFLGRIKPQIKCLREFEIDVFLPLCYDTEFPELKKGKEDIKAMLNNLDKGIESYGQNVNTDKLVTQKNAILALYSQFQEKLNLISSYESFDREDVPHEQ